MKLRNLPLLLAAAGCEPETAPQKDTAPITQEVRLPTENIREAVMEVTKAEPQVEVKKEPLSMDQAYQYSIQGVKEYQLGPIVKQIKTLENPEMGTTAEPQIITINGREVEVSMVSVHGESTSDLVVVKIEEEDGSYEFETRKWSVIDPRYNFELVVSLRDEVLVRDSIQTESATLTEEEQEAMHPGAIALREAMLKKIEELEKKAY